jgi:hypothetical protein
MEGGPGDHFTSLGPTIVCACVAWASAFGMDAAVARASPIAAVVSATLKATLTFRASCIAALHSAVTCMRWKSKLMAPDEVRIWADGQYPPALIAGMRSI